ncbi:MAG: NAD(P)H-hydrate dehydratase [Candidatus Omnitrophota bacterium]
MYLLPYPLRIVTGSVMASIDRKAIDERGAPGLYLMERAGEGAAQGIFTALPPEKRRRAAILCGKGNNGGDGFVIARRLQEKGMAAAACLLSRGEELKGDARTNFLLAREAGIRIVECESSDSLKEFFQAEAGAEVWVDALLGTGSQGAPRGLIAEAIRELNNLPRKAFVASVDIASGVDADSGRVEGDAVYADATFTMGLPKVGHVVPPGLNYGKGLIILDIGLPSDLLRNADSEAELLTAALIDSWLPKRGRSAHKGSEGHILIIAGSRGMTGAALLCSKAAIRMGAGLATCVCPASLMPIYASGVWEMMTLPAPETDAGSLALEAFEWIFAEGKRYSAVVIGPGLGLHPSTQELARKVALEIDSPLLIDGDGLSALSQEILSARKHPWVVTPHPGEMGRLLGLSSAQVQADRWGCARRLASVSPHGTVLLKGPCTVIAQREGMMYVNPTGSPAMASGGMGDALAGTIGALLARGMNPMQAAAAGAFLHGLAADLFTQETGAETASAGQVIDRLQQAVSHVRNTCH